MEAKHIINKEVFKISGDCNQQLDSFKAKFSHLTEIDLQLEHDKEEQWNKTNEIRLHKKWEEVINSIKKLQPVKE